MARPKKVNPLHKMIKEGIERGSWDLICYAYEQETGEKLEVPKHFSVPALAPQSLPVGDLVPETRTKPILQEEYRNESRIITPGGNAPKRIFGNGTNAFKDELQDGKPVTKIGNKKIDSAVSDIRLDKLLKSDAGIDYRQAYKTVLFPCEMCGKQVHVAENEAKQNLSKANIDEETGEKKSIIMCDLCASGRGGVVGPRVS